MRPLQRQRYALCSNGCCVHLLHASVQVHNLCKQSSSVNVIHAHLVKILLAKLIIPKSVYRSTSYIDDEKKISVWRLASFGMNQTVLHLHALQW
jgi:hypothetical protein